MKISTNLIKLAVLLPTTVLLAETALACPFFKQRSAELDRTTTTTILVRDGSRVYSTSSYLSQRPFGFIGVHLADPSTEGPKFSLLSFFNPRGSADQDGVLIRDVLIKGPAQQAGLKPGDVLLGVQGTMVNTIPQIQQIIRNTPVGEDVTITFKRRNQIESTVVQAGDGRYLLDLMLQQQAQPQR